MNENKRVIPRIIIIIAIILVVIVLATLNQNYNSNNSNKVNNADNNVNLYDDLNIDSSKLNIFYLNVGQADSTFITINGINMLIDAGNESDGYYITNFLKAQNIDKIDYFILTHCDEDHIGGAYKILENFQIGTLYMPRRSNETQVYTELLNTIKKNNINTNQEIVASNEILYSLGQANWKILSVDNGNNENDSSIVIELDYINTKYLFMGDASSSIENKIDLNDVDVLKVSHHGSNSATSQEFLEKVKPEYAIISTKQSKNSKLPSQEVIDRLNQNNIKIYRTDQDGTIWITSDGANINIDSLDYNLDGTGRKIGWLFYRRKYLIAFS